MKSYDGKDWNWSTLPEFENLPEDLVLEVLGARTSVIFVEGTPNSFDFQLYSLFYKDYLVLPKGSCENVIQIVKGLKESGLVNDKKIYGIIDRDRRVDAEIDNLKNHNVFVLDVAEVENLFILPEMVKIACEALEHDHEEKQNEITFKIVESLQKELDVQISKRVSGEIRHKLLSYNDKANGLEKIKNSYNLVTSSVDIDKIYATVAHEFDNAITSNNYLKMLQLYNRKSLLTFAGEVLGLKKGEYVNLIMRMSKNRKMEEVLLVLSRYLPTFEVAV